MCVVPDDVPVISLSRPERIMLIEDEKLELFCSTSNINHDFQLTWNFPLQAVSPQNEEVTFIAKAKAANQCQVLPD